MSKPKSTPAAALTPPVVHPVDHSTMKLGKAPPVHDRRTLQFGAYVNRTLLPEPPAARSWFLHPVQWGLMVNDRIGDCTCAAKGHAVQLWTSDTTGKAQTIPDAQIVAAYSAVSGYNPRTGANDNGANMLQVLNYFRRHGIGGHKCAGYAAVPPGSTKLVMTAINLMGVLDIGVSLPQTAQTQDIWDVPPGGTAGPGTPGSWGGHDVIIGAYDPTFLYCVTWGALKRMTWSFFNAYCDEAYAVLSPDWFTTKGRSPGGFNLATLLADLGQL